MFLNTNNFANALSTCISSCLKKVYPHHLTGIFPHFHLFIFAFQVDFISSNLCFLRWTIWLKYNELFLIRAFSMSFTCTIYVSGFESIFYLIFTSFNFTRHFKSIQCLLLHYTYIHEGIFFYIVQSILN